MLARLLQLDPLDQGNSLLLSYEHDYRDQRAVQILSSLSPMSFGNLMSQSRHKASANTTFPTDDLFHKGVLLAENVCLTTVALRILVGGRYVLGVTVHFLTALGHLVQVCLARRSFGEECPSGSGSQTPAEPGRLHSAVLHSWRRTVPGFQSCEGMPGSVVSYSKFCDVTFHRHQCADKERRIV